MLREQTEEADLLREGEHHEAVQEDQDMRKEVRGMLEALVILVSCVIGFIWTMLVHKAFEYGRREGIVAKKDRDEHGDAVAINKTME